MGSTNYKNWQMKQQKKNYFNLIYAHAEERKIRFMETSHEIEIDTNTDVDVLWCLLESFNCNMWNLKRTL